MGEGRRDRPMPYSVVTEWGQPEEVVVVEVEVDDDFGWLEVEVEVDEEALVLLYVSQQGSSRYAEARNE